VKVHTIADPALLDLMRRIVRQLTRIADALEPEPPPPARIPTAFRLSVSGQVSETL